MDCWDVSWLWSTETHLWTSGGALGRGRVVLEEMLPDVDLVIGGVLVRREGRRVIGRQQLRLMKENAMLVDVSIGQAGASRPGGRRRTPNQPTASMA